MNYQLLRELIDSKIEGGQSGLAKLMDVNQGTISKWLSGALVLKVPILEEICKHLNESPRIFFPRKK